MTEFQNKLDKYEKMCQEFVIFLQDGKRNGIQVNADTTKIIGDDEVKKYESNFDWIVKMIEMMDQMIGDQSGLKELGEQQKKNVMKCLLNKYREDFSKEVNAAREKFQNRVKPFAKCSSQG